ncbi:MAG: efflux transporter periplasmic adaptor subunit, partial [Marinovum sp.]|nr:efflux transporter periplasmic adaptor subunit [Marinovum sp.]
MRFLGRGLIGLLLFSLALGLLGLAGNTIKIAVQDRVNKEPRAQKARERTFTVKVVPAEITSMNPTLNAFGEIQSRKTLDLRMAAGGQIQELSTNFVEGGSVNSGELLIRLDDSNYQSAVDLAENNLIDAENEVSESGRNLAFSKEELAAAEEQEELRLRALKRQQDLVKRGVGTAAALENAELAASAATQAVLSRKAAVDQAKNRGAQAETRLVRAELALNDAKRKLEDTVLYAEFSGLLSGVSLVKGGIVSTNERLGQLIDPEVLEVSFKISTQQYTRLLDDNGDLLKAPVSIALTNTDQGLTADGVIIRDSASVAKGQTGRQVYAKLTKSVGFKPGDFVAVKVEEPTLNWVVALPATALDASNSVLLLGEGERLEEAQVKLMRRQGNEVIVRSRDLTGKEIVAQRTPVLGAGIKVKPIRSGEENKVAEVEMLELTEERRAKLISAIESNGYIPKSAKKRIIGQLTQPKVPADVVARIESR